MSAGGGADSKKVVVAALAGNMAIAACKFAGTECSRPPPRRTPSRSDRSGLRSIRRDARHGGHEHDQARRRGGVRHRARRRRGPLRGGACASSVCPTTALTGCTSGRTRRAFRTTCSARSRRFAPRSSPAVSRSRTADAVHGSRAYTHRCVGSTSSDSVPPSNAVNGIV